MVYNPKRVGATEKEEKSYRRGFDQGVAAFAAALDIEERFIEELGFLLRVKSFRYGHDEVLKLCGSKSCPKPTYEEKKELRETILQHITIGEAISIIKKIKPEALSPTNFF
tara:strand:- start:173 stop:505 length:333 start_codon:yes stop_codon:yes gene_type:complete